ncbi:Rne/Rng family ribonuclease [Cognatishimia sp. 1_MG-2023]|uniref:Rne/Rng family ribonuclease n=1 Tax=Cognatishimia sp. 1_MG-2023 TaxID=3062642 RepID=UPI0026E31AAC|nr:Rne/Rng family ribonuclease [Cognatishimia sp. 1_MG-2023]MDO6725422.1 Rne/Rng family ribonuclease [Cognatishimia sp. 1_MG-2023]
MAKKMLIDATHAEETRVVVVDGNKVEEFDFESENKRQLAGNIYLAKVTRVEPSLQAAFVDYGGNRHGFLAFSEIHPDYYQIPVADREALMEEERAYAEAQKSRDEEDEKPKPTRTRRSRSRSRKPAAADVAETSVEAEKPAETVGQIDGMETIDLDETSSDQADTVGLVDEDAPKPVETAEAAPAVEDAPEATPAETEVAAVEDAPVAEDAPAEDVAETAAEDETPSDDGAGKPGQTMAAKSESDKDDAVATQDPETGEETESNGAADAEPEAVEAPTEETPVEATEEASADASDDAQAADKEDTAEKPAEEVEAPSEETAKPDEEDEKPRRRRKNQKASEKDDSIESVADEDDTDDIRPPRKPRPRRYKIQEVIKVRQILLVQVVKEERGNKGAALTTYLSLAGRYCVLMPNTARGGGISRKIVNVTDRKKLKEIATEIDVPQGAGLIIRTAGAKRTKTEIKRDYEYLQRLWEQIRELTLKSSAPAGIYEEGDLIKRSIRDLYNREIDEVLVEGDRGYRIAKDFMKMIMPSHAKNVKNYQDQLPLFARYQVESYLGGMFNPTVQLKSGGYIVIGVTEALVAIDVNSGRATKEGSIEDTATKTNLEAAEEVARQLRLRDLAGLIVIDFIDMDERKNNAAVEKRMKDKLKTDRARIQVGRISGFGLMEMSRQRLRPGMIEATTQPCAHCHGTGLIRSDDNLALNILRQIEEEGTRRRSGEVLIKAPVSIANYLMNQKRDHVAQIEARYGLSVRIEGDPHLISPDFTLEKFKTASRVVPEPTAAVVSVDTMLMDQVDEEIEDAEVISEDAPTPAPADDEGAPKKRRRRRRRRKPRTGEEGEQTNGDEDNGSDAENADAPAEKSEEKAEEAPEAAEATEEKPKRRRRSRSRKKPAEETTAAPEEAATPSEDAVAAEPAQAPEPEAPVEAAAETAEPEAQPAKVEEVAEVATQEAPAAEPTPEPVVETPAPEGDVQVLEKAPEPEVKSDEPPKPKRRGWWSMK